MAEANGWKERNGNVNVYRDFGGIEPKNKGKGKSRSRKKIAIDSGR